MRIVTSPQKMQSLSLAWRKRGFSVGFVPTMGALHQGHLSLMRRARRENKKLVVSIFVNPAQFGPQEDLGKYPRPFARDRRLCEAAGTDVLFHPSPEAMYPPAYDTWVTVEKLAQPLCGAFRPGHFRGVATVVAKLFQAVQPTRAYFGMKDFQQLRVIQRLVEDLNMPVRVVPCATVREKDGLALSSRNAYLSSEERPWARKISVALRAAEEVIKSTPRAGVARVLGAARKILRQIPGARIQYLSVVDPDTLAPLSLVRGKALVAAAVYIGRTRLIDNLLISKSAGSEERKAGRKEAKKRGKREARGEK
jgi:pantoate--beta-alanine ligase